MPWCPICKNEYREGFTHCNDCDMDLVESLDQGPVKIMYGMKEQIEQFHEYLQQCGITESFVRFNPDDKNHDLYVPGPQAGPATTAIRQLIQEQTKEREEEMMELAEQQYRAQLGEEGEFDEEELKQMMQEKMTQTMSRPRKGGGVKKETVYVDKKRKAEEYKSSAFSLIIVGIAGLVFLVLLLMGVLPVRFAGASKVMISTVMGALFLLFLVMGFLSFGSYKKYLVVAQAEADLIDEINAYLAEKATRNTIDSMVKEKSQIVAQAGGEVVTEDDEADMYYVRMRMIKGILNVQYPDADILLTDYLAEEWYGKVYEA